MVFASMNKLNFRNSKKGITPVIATIILIAGTLVLALVVGAYTFGLFGANVKTITLSSGTLFSGSSAAITAGTCPAGVPQLEVSLNNPGSATTVTSVTINGGGISSAPTVFAGSTCTALPATVNGGSTPVTSLTFSVSSQALASGSQYNYVINFANGQSVQGVLTAQ